MKNLIKNILLFLTITSCASNAPIEAVAVNDPTVSGTITFSSPEEMARAMNEGPAKLEEKPAQVLKIKSLTGFNEKNKAEFLKAEIKANEVIQGKCFEDFMINRKLIQANGLSNLEVINKIRTTPIDIDLISYSKKWSKVRGYTLPSVKWVRVNYKYYNGSSVCAKASNFSHEGNHKQGFDHDDKPNKQRPYSVPYSINAAFLQCCGK